MNRPLETTKVGEHYKVLLPGETPWAECLAVLPDGTWVGRIDNHLAGSASEEERLDMAKHFFPGATEPLPKKHDFKFHDLVRFGWQDTTGDGEYFAWVPMEWKVS